MKSRHLLRAALVTLPVLALPAAALAAAPTTSPQTANFNVTLKVQKSCTIAKNADIDFGTVGLIDANIDAAGALDVKCSKGTTYDLKLDNGLNSGGTAQRKMKSATTGELVNYDLFSDTGRTTPWNATTFVSGSGTGAVTPVTIPVYGRVPPQATPTPDTGAGYTDLVTATLTF